MNLVCDIKWVTRATVLLTLVCLALPLIALAQFSTWSPPTEFFEVEDGANVQSPTLLTDSGGNLHAFWGAAMTEGQSTALYYSRWQGDNWAEPVDVLLSPDGGDIWPFLARVDENDYVHMFWSSEGRLWHSMAHASQLDDARLWSQPDIVPTDQEPSTTLAVAQDAQGTWYLVYSNRALDAIFLLKSEDGTDSWTDMSTVHRQAGADTWVGYPGIVVAPDGALWVSWREMESGSGRSKGLAFARSGDGGATWSEPEQLVEGYYFGGFEVVGDIMVKKYGGGVGTGGRLISFSYDNGATWTRPTEIGTGGGEGAQAIQTVIDGDGDWHFVIQTAGTFADVAWDGVRWSPVDFVVPPEVLEVCCTTPLGVTENAAAGISNGNRLHVVFEQDDRMLWYSSRELDASTFDPSPLSIPTEVDGKRVLPDSPTPTQPAPLAPTSTPEGELAQIANDLDAARIPQDSTWAPVALGVAPAIMLVGLTVWFSIKRRRR